LLEGEDFEQSNEAYDWLGPGAYFWEGDWQRAHEWATQRTGSRAFRNSSVVRAVIDLGNCLDLTTRRHLDLLAHYYGLFKAEQEDIGEALPTNEDLPSDRAGDRLLRYLDRAVISFLHEQIDEEIAQIRSDDGVPAIQRFDTVRGLFPEGDPRLSGCRILAQNPHPNRRSKSGLHSRAFSSRVTQSSRQAGPLSSFGSASASRRRGLRG
jgi:hypothetical protein